MPTAKGQVRELRKPDRSQHDQDRVAVHLPRGTMSVGGVWGLGVVRSLYLILTLEDEDRLSTALRDELPDIAFVNGIRWEDEAPPLVQSIAAATARRVLLWDRRLVPVLPWVRDVRGAVEGPSTKYVVSLDRTRLGRNRRGQEVLISGHLFWSSESPSSDDQVFFKKAWRAARACAPVKVAVGDNDAAPGFRAGLGAARWWAEAPGQRYFGLNAVELLAAPVA